MKKRNGFTLIELLAVIVVLSIIVGIAIPTTLAISKNVKKNMFCKKIKLIEEAAVNYGQDNYSLISASTSGKTIKISDLVINGYLKKDVKDAQIGQGAIINPMNNKSMDNYSIKIYINNAVSKNRVRSTCTTALCTSTCE